MVTQPFYYLETQIQKGASVTKFSRIIKIFRYGKKHKNNLYQVLTLDFKLYQEENSNDQLLKKIAFLFDELELEISDQNRIEKVINLPLIKERWALLKHEILIENQGNTIYQYSDFISQMLEDETKVISFLNQLKMLGMIFNGYTQTNAFFTFADGFLLEGHQQQNDNSHNIQYHLMNLG